MKPIGQKQVFGDHGECHVSTSQPRAISLRLAYSTSSGVFDLQEKAWRECDDKSRVQKHNVKRPRDFSRGRLVEASTSVLWVPDEGESVITFGSSRAAKIGIKAAGSEFGLGEAERDIIVA